jgi:hypothetical protein
VPNPPELDAHVVGRIGGFLRNAERLPLRTCEVCTAPVDGYQLCLQCHERSRGPQSDKLADLVVPVVYGGHNLQSQRLLHGYKQPIPAGVTDDRAALVMLLLLITYSRHGACIDKKVGNPVNAWTAVPSTSGRTQHPLRELASQARLKGLEIVATPGQTQPTDARHTLPGRFAFNPHHAVAGRHVLVVDDTWTTGGHAQSMAIDLKNAGASHVTILVLARWLNTDWQPTRDYLSQHPHVDFDPATCPVTGHTCP